MSRAFEIGPFRLDPEAGVLTRDGNPVPLGARAVAVLNMMVEHANEYVPKRRIMDAAWPGVVVEEGNLAVQVAAIRRVLAQAGGERWIETLARRGYRFVGPVTSLPAASAVDPRAAGSPPDLPAPLTSFVGRERQLVEIKRLLPGKRLLTILGAGGIGKTRLALQVAAEVVDAYRDGVRLVELGNINDPALVATSVAQALGAPERAGMPLAESLCRHLRPRQVLVLLDNCEHLLGACAQLANAVLRAAGDVTLLATSRAPLGLDGEQTYPLLPLSLPAPDATLDQIETSEAVQLFVERVQRQLPGFELTAQRAATVAELCIHLDGIPLALELAAARARSLSVEQITARLGDRFRLLTGGSRHALARQQTLRATLDWSYDLLAEAERLVLRRLAIFPASFTVEAAAAVCSDSSVDGFAVIDLLSQLVARSLVIADTTAGATRYRLLETTRAYALEKLVEAGDAESCKRRHAEYLRRAFATAPEEWLRWATPRWRSVYLPELDNVRGALDWALGEGGDSAIAVALAGTSCGLWWAVGLISEGVQRLEAAIARVGPDTPDADQALLLYSLARLLENAPARGRPLLERAVALYRGVGDPLGLGMSLVRLGRALTLMGEFDRAEFTLEESRPLLERTALPTAIGFYFFNSAFLKSFTGNLAGARRDYEQSVAIDRACGDEYAMLAALGNLANVSRALGDLDRAAIEMREQIALLRTSPAGTRLLLAFSLLNFAALLTERGELREALALQQEGLPMIRDEGCAWLFFDDVAMLTASNGRLVDAARLAGFADAAHAANAATRQLITLRVHQRLHAILREQLPAAELERLLANGAAMNADEACRLALAE